MSLLVLQRGEDWLFPASGYVIEKFHQIALEHGSPIRWLPVSGALVTADPAEASRGCPYDDWRLEAVKTVAEF